MNGLNLKLEVTAFKNYAYTHRMYRLIRFVLMDVVVATERSQLSCILKQVRSCLSLCDSAGFFQWQQLYSLGLGFLVFIIRGLMYRVSTFWKDLECPGNEKNVLESLGN